MASVGSPAHLIGWAANDEHKTVKEKATRGLQIKTNF